MNLERDRVFDNIREGYDKVLIICLLVLENQIVVGACGIFPENVQAPLCHWLSGFWKFLSRWTRTAGAGRLRSASVILAACLSELKR